MAVPMDTATTTNTGRAKTTTDAQRPGDPIPSHISHYFPILDWGRTYTRQALSHQGNYARVR